MMSQPITETSGTETGATRTSVVIIGTGFGGVAAAIELKRAGFDDVLILERGDDVGGVWRENTYPGAACDVPSPFYSFSFEPNPRWPHRFSRQPAILDYLRHIAEEYDLHRHIRFGAEVTQARYDDSTGRWTVRTAGGETVDAGAVVPAVGQLSRPSWPDIPGLESFAGDSFHSAQWDHSVDLRGKRVAVIGTGASAIQFVPEIQPEVAALKVFQRTPPYLVPRPDSDFGPRHHTVFEKLSFTQRVERGTWWAVCETLAIAFLYSKPLARAVTAISRRHMRKQVPDPALFAKVWPDYPVGCKRILFSSDYLPALGQPNVEVVTDGIREIRPEGIVDADGSLHEVDVIVHGTGFTASDFLAPIEVRGRGGADLRERWREGAHAYLGLAVPDFPNMFLMYGPNTNVGSGSIVFMLEQQARHLAEAIAHSARAGAPLEVRREVEAAYDAEMQDRLSDSVWTRCNSWYRNANGRISTNWPGLSLEYRRRTAFDPVDYAVRSPAPAEAEPPSRVL